MSYNENTAIRTAKPADHLGNAGLDFDATDDAAPRLGRHRTGRSRRGLAERHVSRQLRLAYLAPEVLKQLTCGREVSAVSLYDLCFLTGRLGESKNNAASAEY